MKSITFLIIGLIFIPFSSAFSQMNVRVDKKVEKIKLVPFGDEPFYVYENLVSIIYLEKSAVIKCLKTRLEEGTLCELRRKNYNLILNILTSNDSSFYTINHAEAPTKETKNMEKETGFFPLDYYSKLVCLNISKKYIPPYGYKIEIDTSNLMLLEKHFDWMISDPILNGHAKIFNKKTGKYEAEVRYEIVHFDGAHGGEQLQFKDNSVFFIVKTYSDMILPDFDCDEEYQHSLEK